MRFRAQHAGAAFRQDFYDIHGHELEKRLQAGSLVLPSVSESRAD